jgi:hypothetical protein
VCDAGYAGPVCTQCWPAFAIATGVGANASATVCYAPESLDLTLLSASVTLRLLGLAGAAGAEGSAARATFAAGLAADLAAALRVGASRFAVASLAAISNGSLVANITVQAPALATDPAASDLAVSLQRMAGDASSALFRGAYTRAVDLAFPPPAALALAPPSAAVFTQSLALGPGLTLQWRIARGRFFGRLSSSRGGWASIGVNTHLGMVGADAILVEPAVPGPSAAKISLITLPSYDGVTRVDAASALATLDAAASNFSFLADGVGWSADFSRLLAAGAYAGALPMPAAGSAMLVAAWGAPADGFVALHAEDAVAMGTVDFATGAFAVAGGDAAALKTAHGVFMALAWAVLVPLAVAALRYGRGAAAVPEVRALAFRLCGTALSAHIRLQSAALLLTLVGLGLAVAAVPAGRHFASAHGAVGLAVLLIALAQPALGVGLSLPAHRALGWGVTAAAVVSVFLGLRLVDATGTLITLYALFLVLSVGAAALLERRVMAKLLRDKLARAVKAGGVVDAFETAVGVSTIAIAASVSASAVAADAAGHEGRNKPTAFVAADAVSSLAAAHDQRLAPTARAAFQPLSLTTENPLELAGAQAAPAQAATAAAPVEAEIVAAVAAAGAAPEAEPEVAQEAALEAATPAAASEAAPAAAPAAAPQAAGLTGGWCRVSEQATGDVWYVRGSGADSETCWELPPGDVVEREISV